MSDRVNRILLVYYGQIDGRSEEILPAAREALSALLGAEEVLFYRKKGTEMYPMKCPLPETPAPRNPIREHPPDAEIRMAHMACMAHSAGRPVCVFRNEATGEEYWFIPLGRGSIWGFVLCETRGKPDPDALQGAMHIADSLHIHRTELLAREEAGDTQEKEPDISAIISHEVKEPLTTMTLAVELLEKQMKQAALYTPGDRIDKCLSRLSLGLYRIKRLTANLESCAGIEDYHCARESVDIAECLERLEKEAQFYAREKSVRFRCERETQLPVLYMCDSFCLERIVLNLMTNAVQHTPEGGCVTVRLQTAAGGNRLTVENDGENIPDTAFAHLFQKFWRGGENRGGMGLGLYISQRFARKMGGYIRAENREEGGARFTLYLPAQSDDSGALESAPAAYDDAHLKELVRTEMSVLPAVQ